MYERESGVRRCDGFDFRLSLDKDGQIRVHGGPEVATNDDRNCYDVLLYRSPLISASEISFTHYSICSCFDGPVSLHNLTASYKIRKLHA